MILLDGRIYRREAGAWKPGEHLREALAVWSSCNGIVHIATNGRTLCGRDITLTWKHAPGTWELARRCICCEASVQLAPRPRRYQIIVRRGEALPLFP